MDNQLISKQAINRLISSPVRVYLSNGCYNVAQATAEFTKYKLVLSVEVTHPTLHWLGTKSGVKLVRWAGCSGYSVPVPECLTEKVQEMIKQATMSDDEALYLSEKSRNAMMKVMQELGITE